MTTGVGCTERTAIITRGDELARAHDADLLIRVLYSRLNLDGLHVLGRLIAKSAEAEYKTGRPFGRAVFYAMALIGRLRIEGRGDLADAVVSSLSGGSPEVDPVLWLNEADAFIAMGRELATQYRSRGLHAKADEMEDSAWTYLRSTLVQRLDADDREDLARAVGEACLAIYRRERGKEAVEPTVAAVPRAPSPDLVAVQVDTSMLARTHAADVWAYAAVARLRADGHDILAASIMMFWAREVAGPIVDPAHLATELFAELRARGRGTLADTIASLLRDVSIERDPWEIMALWLNELARPMVDSGPLAAALTAALRNERRGELADRIQTLLTVGR